MYLNDFKKYLLTYILYIIIHPYKVRKLCEVVCSVHAFDHSPMDKGPVQYIEIRWLEVKLNTNKMFRYRIAGISCIRDVIYTLVSAQ